jgi:hypothetical protein
MANGTVPFQLPDGRMALRVDSNKTLAASDSGLVQNVVADNVTVTLPATVAGYTYTVRNGGVASTGTPVGAVSDASALITVAPNASDGFSGNAFTAATNKAALNTKATAKVGDEIRVEGSGVTGSAGWLFDTVKGVWARQA